MISKIFGIFTENKAVFATVFIFIIFAPLIYRVIRRKNSKLVETDIISRHAFEMHELAYNRMRLESERASNAEKIKEIDKKRRELEVEIEKEKLKAQGLSNEDAASSLRRRGF